MPQSKKTRALLAYLAITGRAHSRERLCGLLWDVADDPRGALRWSLSKIRSLVDGEEAPRLWADRKSVELRLDAPSLDLSEVSLALREGTEALSVERLAELAEVFRGELLEGLDLIEFDAFNAWCAAERERARAMHCQLLDVLIGRLADRPADAVRHARVLAQIEPFDQGQRARLIRLLGAAGHRQEAMAQYESARRLLKDLGDQATDLLDAAVEELGDPGATPVAKNRSNGAPRVEPNVAASSEATPAEVSGRVRPTLVGRQEERARLLSLLGDASGQSRLHALLLKGESGIGKTTLLRDLSREARRRGCTVLEGAAFEAESGRPYGPWIDALRKLPRERLDDEARAALSPLLPELGRPGDDGPSSRDRLFDAVSRVVSSQAAPDRPVLLVFDDLHWCDDATAELLHYVARMNRDLPVAMVLGARDGELVDNESAVRLLRSLRRDQFLQELLLLALSEAETRALVRQMGGSHADDVFHQSGGNPLLAVELTRAAADRNRLVPGSLKELVGDRLARLSSDSADLLRWAAILGTSFEVSRLNSLVSLELDPLMSALSELERHALLEEAAGHDAGVYAFRHALVHRVVYSGLSEPRRKLMHLRVAKHLGGQTDPDGSLAVELAQHASLGGDAVTAARACVMAAKRCLHLFAGAEAYVHARRGLHYADALNDPEKLQLRLELLRLKVLARAPEDRRMEAARIEALAEAALDAGCPEHARLGFNTVSYLRWETGAVGDARRTSLRAELATRGADDESRLRGVAEAARCLVILEKDLPEAEAMLLEARAVSERSGHRSWAACDGLGLLRLHSGELDEAEEAFKEAWTLARQERQHHEEFYSLEHLVQLNLLRGENERAASYARELAVIGDKLREGSEAPVARALLALCRYREGRDESLTALEDAIRRLREVDAKQRLAFVLTHLALFEVERGELARAASRATEAVALAEVLEQTSDAALARAVLLKVARARGEDAEAERLREALSQLRGCAQHAQVVIDEELKQSEVPS